MKNIGILDNYSVKSKLLMIQVFCVLIPVIFSNSIFYVTIKNNTVNEQKTNMKYVVDRVKYNLQSVLDDCILVSNHLNSDQSLNDLISEKYTDLSSYYEKYSALLKGNVINYYYNSRHIYQVTVYTENDTITDSNNFRILTSKVKASDWYRKFCENDKQTTVQVYYDKYEDNLLSNNLRRYISIIRKMDNSKNGNESILKIDVDYNLIMDELLNEKIDGNLYVYNKKYILFSNVGYNSNVDEFDTINNIKQKAVKLQDFFDFKAANEKWNIIVTEDEINPLSKNIQEKEMFFGLIIFNLLLPTIIIALVAHSIRYRVGLLGSYLGKVENEEFLTIESEYGKDEIGKLIRDYNLMVLKIKDLIEVVFKRNAEKQRLELSKKQAELKALQSQVNPHFMFNTLESIRMRSLIKGENETAGIIENLAILLRKTINWGEDYITIEDEMLFVENYLQIQKYRFGDKLFFEHYIMEQCKTIKIPKLSILSFVENACVHGIEEVSHNAGIYINIYKDENNLFIEISDTGSGMDEEKLNSIRNKLENAKMETLSSSKSIGILNTYMRIQMYCNNNMKFEINSRLKEGTEITIQICLDKLIKNDDVIDYNNSNC